MNIIDLSPKLNEQRARKDENERLVSGMLYTTNIDANGHELIYVIGSGKEINNRQALIHWVEKMTQGMNTPYTKRNFELLHDMLQISLDSL